MVITLGALVGAGWGLKRRDAATRAGTWGFVILMVGSALVVTLPAAAWLTQYLGAGIAGTPAAGMFTSPLSPSGNAPATHYIASGMIEARFAPLLTDAAAMYAAAQAAAQPVTLVQCQQLVSDSIVQDADAEGPFTTMARLRLQLIQMKI